LKARHNYEDKSSGKNLYSKAKHCSAGSQIKHHSDTLTVLCEAFTEGNSYVSRGHDVTQGISKFLRVTSHEKRDVFICKSFKNHLLIFTGRKGISWR
jgi:hypothetical protein